MNQLFTIHRSLHRLVFAMDRQAEELLQHHFNLTFSQFRMLMAINHTGQLCQAQIAKFHGLTPAAVSRQIDLLKDKKLIYITQDSLNRRQNILSLTVTGQKQAQAGLKLLDEHLGKIYKQLTKEEQKIFAQSLEKLVGTMCNGKPRI